MAEHRTTPHRQNLRPDWRECVVCERRHARHEDVCGRCLPLTSPRQPSDRVRADVAELADRRPFVVIGRSAFDPYDMVRLASDETIYAARRRAVDDYETAGYTDLAIIDDRDGRVVWTPPAVAS